MPSKPAHRTSLALLLALLVPATTLPAQEMDRKQALAEYKVRYKKIDNKNVEQLLTLSEWCTKVGLKGKVKVLYRKVIRVDPNNEVANKGMGFVQHGDRWVTPAVKKKLVREEAEAAAFAAAEAEKLRLLRLMKLPGEAAAKKGVRLAIEANKELSKKLLESFAKATQTEQSKHSVATGPHVQVIANTSQDKVDMMVQIGEYAYRRANWIAFGKEDGETFKISGDRHLYVVVDPSIWEPAALWIANSRKSDFGTAQARELAGDKDASTSFYWDWPGLAMHAFSTKEFLFSGVANGMGHHWLMFTARRATAERNIETNAMQTQTGKHQMYWMLEGMGIWSSLDAVGTNRYWRTDKDVQPDKYGNKSKKPGSVTGALPQYREMALKLATGKKPFPEDQLHNFYQLTRLDLWRLNRNDLVMAWSFVDYLMRSDTDKWRLLIKDLSTSNSFRCSLIRIYGSDTDRQELDKLLTRVRNDRALDELFGKLCSEIQKQWKTWIETNYKSLIVPETPFKPVG